MKLSSLTMLVALPFVLGACAAEQEAEAAPAPVPMSEAGANAIRDTYAMSYMGRNAAAIAAFYAENATQYRADGTVANGRAAILEGLTKEFAEGYDSLGITSTGFEAGGDEAVDQGTFVLRMLDPQTKEATRFKGNYAVTFGRQADGGFLIVKDTAWAVEEIK